MNIRLGGYGSLPAYTRSDSGDLIVISLSWPEVTIQNRREKAFYTYEWFEDDEDDDHDNLQNNDSVSDYRFRQFGTRRISGHTMHLYRETYEYTYISGNVEYKTRLSAVLQTESTYLEIGVSYYSDDKDFRDSVDGERLLIDFLDECELHDM